MLLVCLQRQGKSGKLYWLIYIEELNMLLDSPDFFSVHYTNTYDMHVYYIHKYHDIKKQIIFKNVRSSGAVIVTMLISK